MGVIHVDVCLYGPLACYGGSDDNVFAQLTLDMDEGTTVRALLVRLEMPTEERGITFINGNLSAMPGLQPDLDHVLGDGDRIAFFHLKSMWPFQYRHDVAMIDNLRDETTHRRDHGLRSRFDT
jgi:hypothetical protein